MNDYTRERANEFLLFQRERERMTFCISWYGVVNIAQTEETYYIQGQR